MVELLSERASDAAGQSFVVDPEKGIDLTFSEVNDRTNRVVGSLRSWGVEPSDHLALATRPKATAVALYFASIRLGLKLIMLDASLPEEKLEDRLNQTDTDYLLAGPPAIDNVPDGWPTKRPDEVITSGSNATYERVNRTRDHELLIFTSGTTGKPKPVRLNWGNMLASAEASAERLGVESSDWWLSPLSVHHVGGLAPMVRSLYNGTRVTPTRYDPDYVLTFLKNYPITGVSLVPTMLRDLLDKNMSVPTQNLRFLLLGGAPTPPDLRQRAERNNLPIHPTYGMTETASQIATATPAEAFGDLETVGRSLSCVDVSILDDGDSPVSPGDTGEIVVDGPAVTKGYYRQEEANRERFGDRGFHTRDLGSMDEQGRLTVHGRTDRSILSGGETIHPGEIETILNDHETVRESRVVGIKDERWGEKLCGVVRAVPGSSVDPSELKRYVKSRLPDHKCPKTFRELDEFPRTASGTIRDDELRELFRDNS